VEELSAYGVSIGIFAGGISYGTEYTTKPISWKPGMMFFLFAYL